MRYLTIALALLAPQIAFATSIGTAIDQALGEVAGLGMMKSGRTYTLPARGETVSGIGDDFLRRREPREILESGLSSGCGDYASAFYGLMRERGADLLFIDAVQLTAASLLNRDNGHTGVAVRDPEIGRWVLVDPTNSRILSYDWDRASTIYAGPGGRHRIWYAGKLEDYPARNHPELKARYDQALRAVPAEVWDKELVRLEFSAGPSMKKADGSFVNPKLPAFLARYAGLYEKLGVHPARLARVTFVDGGPGSQGDCSRTAPDAWECPVGRDSAMSQSLFSWIEDRVTRQVGAEFPKASKGEPARAAPR